MTSSPRSRPRLIAVRVELLEDRRLLSQGGGYSSGHPALIEPGDNGTGVQAFSAALSEDDAGESGTSDGVSDSHGAGSGHEGPPSERSDNSYAYEPNEYEPPGEDNANDGSALHDPLPASSGPGGTAIGAGHGQRDPGSVGQPAAMDNRLPNAGTSSSYGGSAPTMAEPVVGSTQAAVDDGSSGAVMSSFLSGDATPEVGQPARSTPPSRGSRGADTAESAESSVRVVTVRNAAVEVEVIRILASPAGSGRSTVSAASPLVMVNHGATAPAAAAPSVEETRAPAKPADSSAGAVSAPQGGRQAELGPQPTSSAAPRHESPEPGQNPVPGVERAGPTEHTAGFQVLPRADAGGGYARGVDALLAAPPQLADLLCDVLPLDLASMERGMDGLLERIELVRRDLTDSLAAVNVPAWLLVAAAGLAACEAIRAQRMPGDPARRPATVQTREPSTWLPDSAGAGPEDLA